MVMEEYFLERPESRYFGKARKQIFSDSRRLGG